MDHLETLKKDYFDLSREKDVPSLIQISSAFNVMHTRAVWILRIYFRPAIGDNHAVLVVAAVHSGCRIRSVQNHLRPW